jgi:hypothetical protein
MSGHTVGRKRKWPWAVLSVLFALTLAWSFAVVGEEAGGVWSILRIGSAVGLGLCLLRLILVSRSSRRLRRAQDDARRAEGDEGAEAEGQPSGEQPAEERARTYEEVFGLHVDPDAEGLPPAPEDGEWASTSEEDVEAPQADVEPPQADVDEHVDQVEAPDADGGSEEHLRRMREEFRARAEEAALRVKQREAELEAASVADQER